MHTDVLYVITYMFPTRLIVSSGPIRVVKSDERERNRNRLLRISRLIELLAER